MTRSQAGTVHRGPRRKVLIRAQMRAGGPKVDICIRDMSPRGMLIQSNAPPDRGTYVEIVCVSLPIVGQVVWTSDRRFGVSIRDIMDVNAVIREVERPDAASRAPVVAPPKLKKYGLTSLSSAYKFERSRGAANMIQFAFVAGICVIAALGIAGGLYERLSQTFRSVSANI